MVEDNCRRIREKMVSMGCARAFGPRGPSNPVGPVGPRVDSYGGQDFLSGSTTKKHMMCFVVSDCDSRASGPWSGRAFGPRSRAFGPPRCEAPRHVPPAWTTNQYVRTSL